MEKVRRARIRLWVTGETQEEMVRDDSRVWGLVRKRDWKTEYLVFRSC